MYQFKEQLNDGREGERRLDAFFAYWYTIAPATDTQQRAGIDRIFTCLYFGQQFTVEYKTDKTAARTGNAFIETVSVTTTGKRGWAYTSTAEYLVYYVPGREVAYIVPFEVIRAHLLRWLNTYQQRSVPNHGYCTEGVLVPLAELNRIATWYGTVDAA